MLLEELPEASESIEIDIDNDSDNDFKMEFAGERNFYLIDHEWMTANETRINDTIQRAFDTVSILLKNDPHELGCREECSTCKDITGIIKKPFGCVSKSI